MSAQEVISEDTSVQPAMNSWSTPPAGFRLLIEDAPDVYMLLIDDEHALLIE